MEQQKQWMTGLALGSAALLWGGLVLFSDQYQDDAQVQKFKQLKAQVMEQEAKKSSGYFSEAQMLWNNFPKNALFLGFQNSEALRKKAKKNLALAESQLAETGQMLGNPMTGLILGSLGQYIEDFDFLSLLVTWDLSNYQGSFLEALEVDPNFVKNHFCVALGVKMENSPLSMMGEGQDESFEVSEENGVAVLSIFGCEDSEKKFVSNNGALGSQDFVVGVDVSDHKIHGLIAQGLAEYSQENPSKAMDKFLNETSKIRAVRSLRKLDRILYTSKVQVGASESVKALGFTDGDYVKDYGQYLQGESMSSRIFLHEDSKLNFYTQSDDSTIWHYEKISNPQDVNLFWDGLAVLGELAQRQAQNMNIPEGGLSGVMSGGDINSFETMPPMENFEDFPVENELPVVDEPVFEEEIEREAIPEPVIESPGLMPQEDKEDPAASADFQFEDQDELGEIESLLPDLDMGEDF